MFSDKYSGKTGEMVAVLEVATGMVSGGLLLVTASPWSSKGRGCVMRDI
jgi:hypothetical protein